MKQEQNGTDPALDGYVGDGDDDVYEDILVGDEAGLRSLIRACEQALAHGTCETPSSWEYDAVVKLDSAPVITDSEMTWSDHAMKFGCLAAIVVAGACLVIGAKSLLNDIMSLI